MGHEDAICDTDAPCRGCTSVFDTADPTIQGGRTTIQDKNFNRRYSVDQWKVWTMTWGCSEIVGKIKNHNYLKNIK